MIRDGSGKMKGRRNRRTEPWNRSDARWLWRSMHGPVTSYVETRTLTTGERVIVRTVTEDWRYHL